MKKLSYFLSKIARNNNETKSIVPITYKDVRIEIDLTGENYRRMRILGEMTTEELDECISRLISDHVNEVIKAEWEERQKKKDDDDD